MGDGMKALMRLVVALAGCFAMASLANAFGSQASVGSATGSSPSSSLVRLTGDPLVLDGSQFLSQEQMAAQHEARRMTPVVIGEREASRTRFTGMTSSAAAHLAAQAFPSTVEQPAGGLPPLGPGARIIGYPSDHAASLLLPHGQHGVVESAQPMAMEVAAHRRAPIDLRPSAVAGGFKPRATVVPVRIPDRLAQGVALPSLGLSLTPLGSNGRPSAGANGHVDGASVFYANSGTDADTLVKPTASGFEEDTMLRSADSPRQLAFKIGLPAGAKLARGRSGVVSVVKDGQAMATIPSPTAQDAEGLSVPVAVSVSGDLLRLTVSDRGASYRYPIAVDPTVIDNWMLFETQKNNWITYTENPQAFGFYNGGIHSLGATYGAGQFGREAYPTQKESHVYAFYIGLYTATTYGPTETVMRIGSTSNSAEGRVALANWGSGEKWVCAEGTCEARSVTSTNKENAAFFEVGALETSSEFFESHFFNPSVYIDQDKGPTSSVDTTDTTLKEKPNAGTGQWISTRSKTSAVLGVNAFDPGIGVDAIAIKSPNKAGWGHSPEESIENECVGWIEPGYPKVQCNECYETTCVTQAKGKPLVLPFSELGELPEGADTVEATVQDAAGLNSTAKATIHVDNAAPHNIILTGLPSELAAGEFHPKAEATDASSGVKSIGLFVDGKEVASPAGACQPGPCAGKAEWTITGRTYAVGTHAVTIIATDNAGNVETMETTFKVNATSRTGVGPGMVNLASGEFSLSATDVNMGGGLTVGRVYGSRHALSGPAFGLPFGHPWQLTLGGHQVLTVQPNESVVLSGTGSEAIFAKKGAEYESPSGSKNLTLTSQEKSGNKEYVLKDAATATSTTFTQPSKSGTEWVPTIQQGTAPSSTVTYSYEHNFAGTVPTEMLAPAPAGVSCSPELKPGCRALTFVYTGETHAGGENESEWNEPYIYLKEIIYWAYNPVTKEMQKTPVAKYLYDGQLRLRAVWDPRISPALKTKYGYDSEDHLTAMTAPGKETWALTYGTIATDANAGRLLKAMQAPATSPLWAGNSPTDTEAPKITGTPGLGLKLAASRGVWSGSPVSYAYQWKDCNSTGGECKTIPGATNPNYTVAGSDLGYTLVAQVAAINGGGAVTASSAALAVAVPTYSSQFGSEGSNNGQFKTPWGLAVDATGNVWVSDTANNRVQEFNSSGTFVRAFGSLGTGNGQFKSPEAIMTDSKGNVWVADSGNNRVQEFTPEGTFIKAVGSSGFGNGQFKNPEGLTTDSKGNVWVADFGNSRVEEFNEKGEYIKTVGSAGSGNGQLSGPSDIFVTESGNIWVDDEGNSRIEEFNEKGEYVAQCGSAGTGNGQFKSAWRMSYRPDGSLLVADSANNRVQVFSIAAASCAYAEQFGSAGSGLGQLKGPGGVGSHGSSVYVLDKGNSRVEKWSLGEGSAGAVSPEPGYTVEYNVPLSGSGLPTVTEAEVKTWGQTDYPVEAAAIFDADKKQEWPASNYTGATLYYLDGKGDIVNTKVRTGGISTAEYNAANDVVRTLSPDDREAALKEGAKSAEVAKLLDTESTYNGEGTELESRLGPRHLVKLGNGKEVLARAHTVYKYDEGAPSEGGPYRLPTKSTQGALTESEGEQDVRTTTTSYSGQNNLGWKLRKPTSSTVDPGGLKLTRSTLYEEATGNVIETKTPMGTNATVSSPTYAWSAGTYGSGNGQLKEPHGDALDTKGDIVIADEDNYRIAVFNSKGEFVRNFGSKGSGNGQLNAPKSVAVDSKGNIWVADTSNNRIEEFTETGTFVKVVGSVGSGAGQFKEPKGIAIDAHNNIWVSDSLNNRVEEFNEKGEYLKAMGSTGTGNGQFKSPRGLAISPGGSVWVADEENNRVDVFKENGEWERTVGSVGTGNGQFKEPKGVAIAGGTVWVIDTENNRVEAFNEKGEYQTQFGAAGTGNGQFKEPQGIVVDSHGAAYVVDSLNDRVQKWEVPSAGGAHSQQTIYYTAGGNSSYPACGEHPEWAYLPCRVQPASQPETAGLPALPVVTYKYNVWGEPETTTSTSGSATRTTTSTYDGAGRLSSSAITSTVGASLPTVGYKYSESTGEMTEQSDTVEGKAQSLKYGFNTLGQLTSYSEANGTTSTYEYEKEGLYRLLTAGDGKGTQTYGYSETTGEPLTLKDTAATGFTMSATYDAEGNLLTESYPNGMTASIAYNQTGAPIHLEYEKKTHCTEKCVWFQDGVVPTVHGEWATQTSTQATNKYSYDASGRLVQVQNEPTGKGCTTRIYGYDEDTDRTSLVTRAPGTGGVCASEGGTSEVHTYDQADRLLDFGIAYDAYGNVTKLPGLDAGGSTVESSFYTDNRLASQTQSGETIGYTLDPERRIREIVSTGKVVSTVLNHYSAPNIEPSWTSEPSGNTSRNIRGLDRALVATQYNGEAPVLQIANLHGDVVATASMSETATAPASTVAEASEYGVPATEAPPKYSWLGAHELPTQLPSGVVAMGARSYVPQLGRFLQTDPIAGGSANAYSYTYGNPLNTADLSGEYTAKLNSFIESSGNSEWVEAAENRAAENRAAQEEAERKAAEAEGEWEEGEESEEWEEGEEWEEENAAWHGVLKTDTTMEEGVSWRPFDMQGEGQEDEDAQEGSGSAPACDAGGSGPCSTDVGGHAGNCAAVYGKNHCKKAKARRKAEWEKTHPKPSCPKGYIYIPVIKKCFTIELPSSPKMTPVPDLPPVPVPVP